LQLKLQEIEAFFKQFRFSLPWEHKDVVLF
jgi:hypothetical protein